jgi:chromosome segregation ATPase
VRALKH